MKAKDRRAEFASLAAELFNEFGYFQTSMDDIAKSCGIRKPTLYHYFDGKDEILFLIHEEFIDLLNARHEARLPSELSPTQMLFEVMSDIIGLMETHRGHVRVFFENHREIPPSRYQIIQRKRDHYFSIVEGIVIAGIEAGEFESEDPRLATLGIFGMCNWAYTWYQAEGSKRPREVAHELWSLAVNGLHPRRS